MTQKYHCNSPAADALFSIGEQQISALFLKLAFSGGDFRMEELHRLACEWKDHAARLRTMAEASSSSSKQHLLDTASRWTEMARKAERLAERDAAPREFAVSRAN